MTLDLSIVGRHYSRRADPALMTDNCYMDDELSSPGGLLEWREDTGNSLLPIVGSPIALAFYSYLLGAAKQISDFHVKELFLGPTMDLELLTFYFNGIFNFSFNQKCLQLKLHQATTKQLAQCQILQKTWSLNPSWNFQMTTIPLCELVMGPSRFGIPRAWSPWCRVPLAKLAKAWELSATCDTSHHLAEITGDQRKVRVACITLTLSPHLFAASDLARGS